MSDDPNPRYRLGLENEIAEIRAGISSLQARLRDSLDKWATVVGPRVGTTIEIKGERFCQGEVADVFGMIDHLGKLYVSVDYFPLRKDGARSLRYERRGMRWNPPL